MAVFKQELNWSTYQDKQLKVLQDLEYSFSQSLKISKAIKQEFTDVSKSLNSIALATTEILRATTSYTGATVKATTSTARFSSALNNTTDVLDGHLKLYDEYGNVLTDITEKTKHLEEDMISAEDAKHRQDQSFYDMRVEEEKRSYEYKRESFDKVMNYITTILDNVARSSNEYSDLSNSMVKLAESDMPTVTDFRRVLTQDIVPSINTEIGKNYYNPKQSYNQLVSIANSSDIGNIDTLKDLTRPLLLAQETMNLNLDSLAKLLGRWSVRYDFSSASMETIVNDIRGYTSNNMASSESVQQDIAKLDTWLVHYAKGDTEELAKMVESITAGSAWINSMGIKSDRYTQYIEDIASGAAATDTRLIQLLDKTGTTPQQAQELFQSGDGLKLYQLLYDAEVQISKNLTDTSLAKQVAERYGMDIKELNDVGNTALGKNYVTAAEFAASKSDTTATEIVADKYISLGDRIGNTIDGLYVTTAEMQESAGIGWDDVSKSLGAIAAALTATKLLPLLLNKIPLMSGFLEKIGISIGAAKGGASMTGILSGIGGALGAAGIGVSLAGGATVLTGIGGLIKIASDISKDKKTKEQETYKSAEQMLQNKSDGKGTSISIDYKTDDKGKATPYITYGTADIGHDTVKDIDEAYAVLEKSVKSKYKSSGFMSTVLGYGRDDSWTSYVPIIGGLIDSFYESSELSHLDDSKDSQKEYYEWITSLDKSDLKLAQVYGSKLAKSDEQLQFMMDNFSRLKALSDNGFAVTSMDKQGLSDTGSRKSILGYARGSNFITEDQLAILHKGEAVTPKQYNPEANKNELEALRSKDSNSITSLYEQNKSELAALKASMNRDKSKTRESETTDTSLSDTVSVLQDIKLFLESWKAERAMDARVESTKNRFRSNSDLVASYLKD